MSDAVRELKDKAAQLVAKGKLPAALETWRKVVELSPEDVGARQKIAELLVKQSKPAEAVEAYEDVARRFAEMGLFFKASAVCRLILGLDPAHQRTLELIASLYSKSKRALPTQPAAPVAPPPPPPEALADTAAAAPPEEIDFEIEIIAPPTSSGLPSIPLFSMLSQEELKEVLGAMEVRSYGAGEVVVAEGAEGDSMFALVEGVVGVFRGFGTPEQRRVASMSAGEIFGEVALVSGGLRVATVVADDGALVLEFKRPAMVQVIGKHPGVGAVLDQFYRERLLANMMRASPILRELPAASKKQLAAKFVARTFPDGHCIVSEGERLPSVHMLLRGVCSATHKSGAHYPDLREGDLFGELSVLTDGPATASVTAVGPVLTLELNAAEFKGLVMENVAAAIAVKTVAKARLERTARFDRIHAALNDKRI